jgi:hypothetical protein
MSLSVVSTHACTRPKTFRLDPNHRLSRGLVFAALGYLAGRGTCHDGGELPRRRRNHGTLANGSPATAWPFDAELGRRVLQFDGIDDYVEADDHASLQLTTRFSFALWLRRTRAVTAYDGVFGKWSDEGGWGVTTYGDNDRLRIAFRKDETNYWSGQSNTALAHDVWYHCAVVYPGDGTTPRLWIDGVEETGLATWLVLGDALNGIGVPAAPLSIGRENVFSGFQHYWQGRVADPCLWNRLLSAGEVCVLASRDPFYRGWIRLVAGSAWRGVGAAIAGPYRAVAGRVWHTGTAAGRHHVPGARQGQVFSPGQLAGVAHG